MAKARPYIAYARDVVSGKQPAGTLIKLACRRFLDDMKRKDLVFRRSEVDRCIAFIGLLRHTTGKFSGKPFVMQPWQQWVVANIVGLYKKSTGTRKYTQSYIEMCRKQGKTAMLAALSLYFLIADGEDAAEVDLAANSKEQAKIAFRHSKMFCKSIDPEKKMLLPYRDTIRFDSTDSIMNVFASDDSTLDGYNASFGVIDEYHSAPDSSVRDVIKSSMGMRTNPHLCTITTAGFDKSLPCYELRTYGVEVLNRLKNDDDFFVAIYEMDEDDDWRDEANWIKCAPNLDVTVTREWLRAEVNTAVNSPREEVNVKTKNLNIWCDTAKVWIPESKIIKCSRPIDWTEFNPDEDLCYVGVDLSAVSDLTAVAYLIIHDGKYYVYVDYYCPQEALETKTDKDKYRLWHQLHELHVTPGNVTDYDYITQDIIRHNQFVTIVKIGYDKWNATQWAIDCTNLGMPLEEYPQTLGNFNRPTRELERLMLKGDIILDDNEINRFCFRNVELKSDWNGNVKPIKDVNKKKIDGVIAIIEALGCMLLNPRHVGPLLTT
ncbi:terminase large subunit [Prevotella sp. KH2C16]|uniref:terminase large subunit n=1 Tax=Prevotella sp. KH2C16 TaxID=1855325 RepID=UPI0008E16337|nr:terminase TerL endonuclease subunit [Prevotella sp. KH2C16]SFF96687.1 Phage terminase-like protein, large subunit, contains N-terminal HTH domain [Prevotella sp. KH2C16]